MPGSTFKVLTTSIALDMGVVVDGQLLGAGDGVAAAADDNPIQNYDGSVCGGDLLEVFTRSCNIPFARIAVENIGIDGLHRRHQALGRRPARSRSTCPGRRPAPSATPTTSTSNLPLLAMRGFGQNEVQMVPLHMAMVASTIANGGVMMKPYVVDATLDSDGEALTVTERRQVWLTPITAETAATHEHADAERRHQRHGQSAASA